MKLKNVLSKMVWEAAFYVQEPKCPSIQTRFYRHVYEINTGIYIMQNTMVRGGDGRLGKK